MPSQILFSWTGPNASRSELITLDPTKWKGLGKPPGSKGYAYKDPDAAQGGVKKIVHKQASSGRKMKVVIRGAAFLWEVGGPHDGAQVHFHLGARRLCASFGGDIKKNGGNVFLAKSAPEPAACPAQTCGNGIVESPESDGAFDTLLQPVLSLVQSGPAGLVGYAFGTSELCGTIHPLTLWEDEASMLAFVTGTAHLNAVTNACSVSTDLATTNYPYPETGTPIDFDYAWQQLGGLPPYCGG